MPIKRSSARKNPDDHIIDINQVTIEAEQYVRMLRDEDESARKTKLYRFARTILAYKVAVVEMERKLMDMDRLYQELKQEHQHLAERSSSELEIVKARLQAIEARLTTPLPTPYSPAAS